MPPTSPPNIPTVSQTADDMLMVDFGGHPEGNHQVRAFWRLLGNQPALSRLRPVAGMHCVGFMLDQTQLHEIDIPSIADTLLKLAASSLSQSAEAGKCIDIPVCYDATFALDLEALANHCGLSAQEVIERHVESRYIAQLIGFLPGFAYLGGLDPALATPRLATPRPKVPAGSLGIAGMQCAVYPTNSPGGWNLIGRSPICFFDPNRNPPAKIELGDEIRFVPISLEEFERQWASR